MNQRRGLADYVDVATRVSRFYEKYPEGSLQSEITHDDGERVVIKAFAFRIPDDASPGIGHAEEVRGSSPVNKTSAIENCETSAWGRALAALGFEVKQGIASREEVQQAQAEERRQASKPAHDESEEAKELDAENRLTMEMLSFDEGKIVVTLDNYRTLDEKRRLQAKLLAQAERDGVAIR